MGELRHINLKKDEEIRGNIEIFENGKAKSNKFKLKHEKIIGAIELDKNKEYAVVFPKGMPSGEINKLQLEISYLEYKGIRMLISEGFKLKPLDKKVFIQILSKCSNKDFKEIIEKATKSRNHDSNDGSLEG